MCNISDFFNEIDTIIDCWYLYQMKKFKDMNHPLNLNHFPMWSSSNEVCFLNHIIIVILIIITTVNSFIKISVQI